MNLKMVICFGLLWSSMRTTNQLLHQAKIAVLVCLCVIFLKRAIRIPLLTCVFFFIWEREDLYLITTCWITSALCKYYPSLALETTWMWLVKRRVDPISAGEVTRSYLVKFSFLISPHGTRAFFCNRLFWILLSLYFIRSRCIRNYVRCFPLLSYRWRLYRVLCDKWRTLYFSDFSLIDCYSCT